MTDDRSKSGGPADLAAEFALGALTGSQLREARDRVRSDPQFKAEVARWYGRLAPMLEEVGPVAPPTGVWAQIGRRIGGPGNGGTVIVLQRQVRQWRGVAAAMSALAACLAVVMLIGLPHRHPAPIPVEQLPSPPLVAMLGDQQRQMKVVASWDPSARQLILAVAGDMPADPNRSHELWVIPAGGAPRSLGTMDAGKRMHMRLADALAQLLQQGAIIAISVEPRGGSPTGAPTGPVVASGALAKA